MRGSQDQIITQHVNNKLAKGGICTPCRVSVQTKNGDVTLSGTVQYIHQKGAAMKAASGIAGVRRVVDQMSVKPRAKC